MQGLLGYRREAAAHCSTSDDDDGPLSVAFTHAPLASNHHHHPHPAQEEGLGQIPGLLCDKEEDDRLSYTISTRRPPDPTHMSSSSSPSRAAPPPDVAAYSFLSAHDDDDDEEEEEEEEEEQAEPELQEQDAQAKDVAAASPNRDDDAANQDDGPPPQHQHPAASALWEEDSPYFAERAHEAVRISYTLFVPYSYQRRRSTSQSSLPPPIHPQPNSPNPPATRRP